MKIRISILSLLFACTGAAFANTVPAAEPDAFNRDPAKLHLASGSSMIVDVKTDKVLYASNPDIVVPIASVTKLMTAMVVLDARLPMNEMIPVTIAQTKEMKGVFSRVKLGSELDRRNMLLIALMSSENRAAASLAHSYPGGYNAFIQAMNAKAKSLGMKHTVYVEPTGLSVFNVSTARDLSKLVLAARAYPMLSELSTTSETTVTFRNPRYSLVFNNTDHLIKNSSWDIKLTKTGFTNQAGHCLVLLTTMANRQVAVVILDAFGKLTHFADAGRMRNWMETGKPGTVAPAAVSYRNQKNQTMRQIGVQAKE
ncbi:D-alanyl-D-alanine endopeptidase [Pseudomonas sp. NA-150]|uniref:D-alanyl-D-alanine endopeptidase n=1 Tax=Pseudomonas sp. NA-150 TaxID=3367525 RepID=UPI0037CB2E82